MPRLKKSYTKRQLRARFVKKIHSKFQLAPRLEVLEDRLPPGDTILGAVIGQSLIASSLVFPDPLPKTDSVIISDFSQIPIATSNEILALSNSTAPPVDPTTPPSNPAQLPIATTQSVFNTGLFQTNVSQQNPPKTQVPGVDI